MSETKVWCPFCLCKTKKKRRKKSKMQAVYIMDKKRRIEPFFLYSCDVCGYEEAHTRLIT